MSTPRTTKKPRKRTPTYDYHVALLAASFLNDQNKEWTDQHEEDLSATIQEAIEDWLKANGFTS